MSQVLEDYFEHELTVFEALKEDFARRYPAEAGRLLPDPDRVVDPHLDRMIEGFALLAGRVHHKIDAEFPELSEALLEVLYPHLLTPVPAMSIAQFSLEGVNDEHRLGVSIAKNTQLRTRPLGNPPMPCGWRTGYPVTLWPVRVVKAQVLRRFFPTGVQVPPRTAAALVLHLECHGPWTFADLSLEKLRFYLSGDRQVIANLYEVLFNHTLQVVVRSMDASGRREPLEHAPGEVLFPVGFEQDEGLLPFRSESFVGYRLLTEFLSFREKFLFVDLGGWRQASQAGFGKTVEIIFFLNRAEENLEQGVTARTFLLGCTPIINLFVRSAEPLALTQRTTEYRVVPSRNWPLGLEIINVDAVTALDPVGPRTVEFQPFYAYSPDHHQKSFAFWRAARRNSYLEGDSGTEVYLTLVDSDFQPQQPAEAVLNVHTTCSNRDWPGRFQRAGEPLTLSGGAPGPITCLHLPTAVLRPSLRQSTYWRLLAQNNLNHISLTDPTEGLSALQEILRLCDMSDPKASGHLAAVNQQIIEGITAMRCRPAMTRISQGAEVGYCRGQEVLLEFDEKNYIGVGLLLYSSVLERFLGLYAGVNSFSQLVAKTKQSQGYFKKWPPRAADRQLL